MLRHTRRLSPLALVLALAACDRTPTTLPRLDGEVTATITDDSGSPVPPALPTLPTGTLSVDASVELVAAAGGVQGLASETPSPTVDLGSTSAAPFARAEVSPIRYTTLRMTFTRAEANVTGGLTVSGTDVRGAVSVTLPQPVVVERAIDITVVSAGHHEVVVDLNSEAWLNSVDPASRTVPQAALISAVTVQVR